MKQTIYLRMRQRIKVSPNSLITIGNVTQILTNSSTLSKQLLQVPIYEVKKTDKNFIVINIMDVLEAIQNLYPGIDIQTIGPAQTLIEVEFPTKTISKASFILVWLLLFIGAGLAIMNFHEDVSMQAVHQNIYYMITGELQEKPLLLQIPYSLGLGIGMILFFNHLFRKRLNEEPSPLEVEIFKYQQDLDQYTILNEMKELKTNDND